MAYRQKSEDLKNITNAMSERSTYNKSDCPPNCEEEYDPGISATGKEYLDKSGASSQKVIAANVEKGTNTRLQPKYMQLENNETPVNNKPTGGAELIENPTRQYAPPSRMRYGLGKNKYGKRKTSQFLTNVFGMKGVKDKGIEEHYTKKTKNNTTYKPL
jgi:hypothetical protein